MDSGIYLSDDEQQHSTAAGESTHILGPPLKRNPALRTKKCKFDFNISEFVSFAFYKILNPTTMGRRHTENITSSNPGPVSDLVISPPGTESWYPAFVMRVHKLLTECQLSLPCIFVGLIYVYRHYGHGRLKLQQDFKLLLAAMILAQKQHSDFRYSNKAWSKMSGVSIEEINVSERELLMSVGWDLYVTEQQYDHWNSSLQALGKDHVLVLRATQMQEDEFKRFEDSVQSRPDLLKEIVEIRKWNTLPR